MMAAHGACQEALDILAGEVYMLMMSIRIVKAFGHGCLRAGLLAEEKGR
jgi:hypothetical protein